MHVFVCVLFLLLLFCCISLLGDSSGISLLSGVVDKEKIDGEMYPCMLLVALGLLWVISSFYLKKGNVIQMLEWKGQIGLCGCF